MMHRSERAPTSDCWAVSLPKTEEVEGRWSALHYAARCSTELSAGFSKFIGFNSCKLDTVTSSLGLKQQSDQQLFSIVG